MTRMQLCLNGEWDFMPIYDQPVCRRLPEKLVYEPRKVQVPSSWRGAYEPEPGRLFGEVPEHGYRPMDLYGYPREWEAAEAGVLHRTFRVPEEMKGRRIVLRLDGIMQKAAVYVDRKAVAIWEDGYLPLRLDITALVRPGEEHHLHVVCGSFDKTLIPSGQKKVTGLTGSWYSYICRGIWQDVFLESCPKTAIEDVTIRTLVRGGRLEVDAVIGSAKDEGLRGAAIEQDIAGLGEVPAVMNAARMQGALETAETSDAIGALGTKGVPGAEEAAETLKALGTPGTAAPLRLTLKIRSCSTGETVMQAETAEMAAAEGLPRLCENEQDGPAWSAAFRLEWNNAKLWSPDSPELYLAELELYAGETLIDRKEERFGFREIWSEGSRFMLNGIPVNLRGDSWHFQGGAQQTEAYVRTWYRMCKEAGVNSIRLHAEPYPAYYVSIADEEGMLIVDETAIYGSGKTMQADHPDYIVNCRAHIRRLVIRDKNHPSVIMWSIQNEMRWVDGRDGYKQFIPEFMEIIRNLDPTRPMIVEGDNRLLPKELTEVESRHYNIDGTIGQWDRSVPLTFGEHGGWWYICPQNSSMYVGLAAYRHTDEAVKGLAEKERLFVEHARREGVSGVSTFNFAHYFMRAMPERDIELPQGDLQTPGVKPKRIPAYSLSLNNGLLPAGYPAYRKNPAWDILAAAFKPATILAAEYNRSFYDDKPIRRSFDVYNDTLLDRDVKVQIRIEQNGRAVHDETFAFRQAPADRRLIRVTWTPEQVQGQGEAALTAVLYHDGAEVHRLEQAYRLYPTGLKSQTVEIGRRSVYLGTDSEYERMRRFLPACGRIKAEELPGLQPDVLLIVGSGQEDPDGGLEQALKAALRKGAKLLLLEQRHLSLGDLKLTRRGFFRAHAGSYAHPVFAGLGDDDLMFWHEGITENGPLPIIQAAFEKPETGDFRLLLECSEGDFGDGGDLWSPMLEYKSGEGRFLACQLDIMSNMDRVPQACLLLRNLLSYAGQAEAKPSVKTAAWVREGSTAAAFLGQLALAFDPLHPGADVRQETYGLLIVEPSVLETPEAAAAARRFAERGGHVVVLPAEPGQEQGLTALLGRETEIRPQETYQLEADDRFDAVGGFSPVDLFGFDKVHLSPREVVNRPLALNRISARGADVLCRSIEGTAWKDYFVHLRTAEYSRIALVELNKDKARTPGGYVIQTATGAGTVICSQILTVPESAKSVRLYSRLLANLGAAFHDGLLERGKGDAEWAVEAVMALPCPPHVAYEEMKAYYIDPEFSLNNLGEGLYGWMKKKERGPADGKFRIPSPGGQPWFFSCFVHVPQEAGTEGAAERAMEGSSKSATLGASKGITEGASKGITEGASKAATEGMSKAVEVGIKTNLNVDGEGREAQLRILTDRPYAVYINGKLVGEPEAGFRLRTGVNRLIVIVQSGEEDLSLGMVFMNPDGTYMNDLSYRMTMDEVEPK